MCRITGFWDPQDAPWAKREETIKAMRDSMTYGGPDDAGFFLDQKSGLALGHRRLAILDLSPLGHQPMFSVSGRFGLVYNGEVYNYRTLAKELESRGRVFKGTSDSEVILEAIEEWGIEKAVGRCVGMFALAVWDSREKILLLVRDRLGIKPLYYGWINDTFVFASELKAFRAYPGFSPSVDREVLGLFFRHNYIPAPYSIYKNIWKLMPGQILTLNQTGLETKQFAFSTYWSAGEIIQKGKGNPYRGSLVEAQEELEALLTDAIQLRLVSDVPLGAFLSGGIDSSTVVSLMQARSNTLVRTFSIGFDMPAYNEAPFAKAVADHLGTDHTELYVTEKEAQGMIPLLPTIYDEPFADSSQIPTYILSKLTKQYVTVSLSGDGGDELFAGYDRYAWGKEIWQKMGWMPDWMKKSFRTLLLSVSPSKWDVIFSKFSSWLPTALQTYRPGDRVHKLADSFLFHNRRELYQWLVSHWREPMSLVNGMDQEPSTVFDIQGNQFFPDDFIQEMQYLDLVSYLPDDILTKVDRASMAVALEARVPLLDHRVVEFAWRLPLEYKLHDGKGKWILRRVLDKYVPEKMVERPKMGFGIPIDSWLRGPLKEWAEDLLSENRLKREGFINHEMVRLKWQEHLSGKRNWQYLLWDVLMWEAWLDTWG
ncbi:MAG: asparagine synthase (glutamine-hydrolyzing) [Pseudomonadota bacterium]